MLAGPFVPLEPFEQFAFDLVKHRGDDVEPLGAVLVACLVAKPAEAHLQIVEGLPPRSGVGLVRGFGLHAPPDGSYVARRFYRTCRRSALSVDQSHDSPPQNLSDYLDA